MRKYANNAQRLHFIYHVMLKKQSFWYLSNIGTNFAILFSFIVTILKCFIIIRVLFIISFKLFVGKYRFQWFEFRAFFLCLRSSVGDVTFEKKTRRPDISATYDILKKILVFSQKKMSKQGQNLLILFLTCLNFIRYTHSYYITVSFLSQTVKSKCNLNLFSRFFVNSKVDARDEQCFFDKVKTGTKLGLIFEVVEGGALDIDVRIEGKIIFSSNCQIIEDKNQYFVTFRTWW